MATTKKMSRGTVLNATLVQPRFTGGSPLKISATLNRRVEKLNLKTAEQARQQVKALKLTASTLPGALATVYQQSSTNAQKFTSAVIDNWKSDDIALKESHSLVNWARTGDSKQRLMLCRTFKAKRNLKLLVHNVGGMNRKDARTFMKDYFRAGADIDDITEWLTEAGNFLREFNKPEKIPTDGLWSALKKAGKKAGDWVKGAINIVADAVKAAGKNLFKAIEKVASWAQSKIDDFVEALVRAGKRVADILREAVRKGLTALKKFIQAVLRAGRSALEILQWAVTQVSNTIKETVRVILSVGRTVAQIISSVLRASASLIRKTVKALLDLGKSIAQILLTVANQALSRVQQIVGALIQAGKSVFHIVKEVVSKISSTATKVVSALLRLGQTAVSIMATTVGRLTASAFRLVVKALKQAGQAVRVLLSAAAKKGRLLVEKLVSALASLGEKVKSLLDEALRAGAKAISWVINGIKIAGQKAAAVLNVIAGYVGFQLKRLIIGFYHAFRDPIGTLNRFAKSAFNTVRMVLDGLLSAGLSFGRAVKEILSNIPDAFRKGFFKGLVALGKSFVDIMKEALKLTGALAALALATILDITGGHRGLTPQERREALRIFGSSIDLNRVKISVANIPADLISLLNNPKDPGARPFTTMYVLNFASWKKVDLQTLIHELTHTWQGVVAGPVYMIEALHAQLLGDGYEVNEADLTKHNGNFSKFNREQQASIVELYWAYKFGSLTGAVNAADWITRLEPYAQSVFKPVRVRRVGKFRAKIATAVMTSIPRPVRVR